MRDIPGEDPWGSGAISTAERTGVAPGNGISLTSVALTCAILPPENRATVLAGPTPIAGCALAGGGCTTDAGQSWVQVDVGVGPATVEPQGLRRQLVDCIHVTVV